MKIQKLYAHPRISGVEEVKVGFSWPAFFLGPWWMLYKRLWGLAVAWFILWPVLPNLLLSSGAEILKYAHISGPGMRYVLIFWSVLPLPLIGGLKGNNWVCQRLEKRGWHEMEHTPRDQIPRKICPYCDEILDAEDKVCPSCGKDLAIPFESDSYCPKCKKTDAYYDVYNKLFCPNCKGYVS